MPSANRPKILWLSKGLNRGGVEVLLRDLALTTALAEYELHVASVLTTHLEMADELRRAGVTVHDLGGRRAADLRWVLGLVKLLRRERFDLIHCHSPLPASAARVCARAFAPASRTLTTEHNSRSLYHPATRLLNDVTARLDVTRLAVSRATADAETRWDRRPLTVVYQGRAAISGDVHREGIREQLGLSQQDFVVMAIANMRKEKNLPLLVEAFSKLRDVNGRARLVIIGDGAERAAVQAAVQHFGVADRAILTGSQPEASRYLAGADVFCMSSDHEGLPVAMMEALQSGLPIVATDVGGVAELVEHDVNGLLVPRGRSDALAAALSALADDDKTRKRLGQSATVTAARFSVDNAARELASIYERCLEGA